MSAARVSKLFTSHLHGEILNFFYLYNTRVTDPLPLYLYIVKIEDFHQILTAFLRKVNYTLPLKWTVGLHSGDRESQQ